MWRTNKNVVSSLLGDTWINRTWSHKLDSAWKSSKLILKHSTACPFRLSGIKDIKCYFCASSFEDPVQFRMHVNCQHNTIDRSIVLSNERTIIRVDTTHLLCRLCMTPHDTLELLGEHLKAKHELDINTTATLRLVPLKLEKDRHVCLTCGKKFTGYKELSRHSGSHILRFICHICGKNFQELHGLEEHLILGHPPGPMCRVCRRTFPTKDAKKQHVRENKSCMTFPCKQCNERFPYWELKVKHMSEKHGQAKQSYPCKECGMVFYQRCARYQHFKATHTEDLKCHICNKTFPVRQRLIEHGFKHSGERPYKCNICEASFDTVKNHRQHVKIHDDSKKLGCPVCAKLFVDRTKIKYHVSKQHPDVFDQWALKMNYKTN